MDFINLKVHYTKRPWIKKKLGGVGTAGSVSMILHLRQSHIIILIIITACVLLHDTGLVLE